MKSLTQVVLTLVGSLCLATACSSNEPAKQAPSTCQSDMDCAEGHCDPKSGCVACLFDEHCGSGERCANGSCFKPTKCNADDDCSAKESSVCDPRRGECVRCLTDQQCGNSAHCREGSCVPYEHCAAEKDCPSGSHCDLGSGECVACLTKGDCPAGSECSAGECRLSCKEEASCSASGSHCTSAGVCGECANDTHCPDVYHCDRGACVRDMCEQGTARCAEDGASIGTCSPNGDALLMSQCATGQSCGGKDGAAACQPWSCAPASKSCAKDGTTVETCAADGLSITDSTACADGESCVAGTCVTLSCRPNAAFCKDGASYTCSVDGTDSILTRACTDDEHCDDALGKCQNNVCTPGSKACVARDLGTCRADGSGYDYAPCVANQICTDGECKALACVPSSRFCSGDDVMACNSAGTGSVLAQACRRCVSVGGSAYCTDVSCTPGTPLCDGSRATVCAQDGNGTEPNGVDCSALGGYCDAGVCHPNVCTPNARSCQGEYMYVCSSDGRSQYAYSGYSCDSYYWGYSHCNPATGACQAQACTPNSTYCSSGVAYSCDATGYVATAGENCEANGKVCVQGTCVAKTCNTGTYFCKAGNPHYCSDGVSSSQQDTCGANEYCLEGYYYCQADVCEAGKPVCNGNAVATCAADGSGPGGAGTACGANKTCVNGACVPVTCTANTLMCLNGHVQACNGTGTGASLYQYCVNETYCDAGTTTCKPDVCPAGKPYCDAETLKTCLADGSSSGEAGTACKPSGKVCTPAGCVPTAVELVATPGTTLTSATASDYILGDVIKVSQQRKLTKMEMSLGVASGPLTAHWVIYSSTDNITFYQVADTATSIANTADTWVGSSALNVTLEAGIYYLLGLELIPTGSTTITYHTDSLSTPTLSFAQVTGGVGRLVTGAPASFKPSPTSTLYHMRLATTLP